MVLRRPAEGRHASLRRTGSLMVVVRAGGAWCPVHPPATQRRHGGPGPAHPAHPALTEARCVRGRARRVLGPGVCSRINAAVPAYMCRRLGAGLGLGCGLPPRTARDRGAHHRHHRGKNQPLCLSHSSTSSYRLLVSRGPRASRSPTKRSRPAADYYRRSGSQCCS